MENIKAIKTEWEEKNFNGNIIDRFEKNGIMYGYKVIIPDSTKYNGYKEFAELRTTASNSGAFYAMAWIHADDDGRGWRRGTARTGSNNTCGGYNKRGAVTREALENCGYRFRAIGDDDSYGFTSEERAEPLLKAIAEAEGIENYLIIEMHY